MKAAYLETTGGPDVIQVGELPTPTPLPGQVLVKVGVAALNPVDAYLRAGLVTMPMTMPFITGSDFAGTVSAVGDGVKRFQVGDRVWGSNQGLLGRPGTFAEFVSPDEEFCYLTFAGVTDETAAALALTGITAWLGLFHRTNLVAGETVFVNGGTGGVGSLVIQMAKAIGAKVICTVGSHEKAEIARGLGADTVINYKTDDVTQAVLDVTAGKGADVYYETQPLGDIDAIVARTAPFGRIVVIAGRKARPEFPNGPFYVKGLALFGFAMFNISTDLQRRAADAINELAAAGKLKPLIGARLPLDRAADAHRMQDDNTLGKVGTLSGKIVMNVE